MLRVKFCAPNEIIAAEPVAQLRESLAEKTGITVTAENAEVAEKAEIILLGVKPAVVLPVIKEIAPLIGDKLVISLAAGIRLESMEPLAAARFMRVMTNTPSAIARAASAFACGNRSSKDDIANVMKIFGAIGAIVQIDEKNIDAVTALAGSGPAFVYTVIEALAQGGSKAGLPNETSLKLATQMVLGAAQLAAESNASPEELRRAVATAGGTTAAGLAAMEKLKTSEGLIAAVEAAAARSRAMAQES